MCEAYNRQYGTDFLSIIPTNVYGPGQRYPRWPMGAMVIPSLIRRFHEATANKDPRLSIWGTGRPSRDFLFVDDLVEAIVFLMNSEPEPRVLNIGTGRDYTIRELADILRRVSGYEGEVVFDVSKPDGMLVKLQDVGRIHALGWSHKVDLEEGIRRTYEAYIASART
jgi:GDP-L-fucose synthase